MVERGGTGRLHGGLRGEEATACGWDEVDRVAPGTPSRSLRAAELATDLGRGQLALRLLARTDIGRIEPFVTLGF